jgi:hypothetical protein
MPAETRRIIVTGLQELSSGRTDRGEWTLYKVTATTAAGAPIRAELRTFERLPTGQEIDMQVEARRDGSRLSYTLRRPRAGRQRLQEQLDRLTGRVDRLERDVQRVQDRLEPRLPLGDAA